MKKNKITAMFMLGFLIVALITTSVGGAFASSAYAAEPGQEGSDSVTGGNNRALGLVALGLLAILTKSGGKSGDTSAGSSPASSQLPASQPTTTKPPVSQPTKPPTTPTPTKPPASTPSSGLTADEQLALNLLNADRAANGLPPLKSNMSLVRLSENYAQDMINRHFFAHNDPDGLSPFDRMRNAGISYRYAGENLAINQNVKLAEAAFMNSPGHRANILNPNYTQVGIGVRYDANGSVYVVQEFIGN